MLTRFTSDYNFIADPRTGITMRGGTTLNDDPIWAPVPELADISISNHCTKGCSFCYRDSWKSPVCVTPEAQVPLTLESKFRMTPIKS